MENRQVKRENVKIISALIILMLILSCLFSIVTPFNVLAESEIEYTSVLEDLEKDENFNIEEYPVIEENYSLQVIQIAESEDNELFIYVYQPNSKYEEIKATSINISTTYGDTLNYINYKLIYLDNYQTIFKYKVDNFTVSDKNTRYYEISSIFRLFNSLIDEEPDNENIVEEVSYKVGKAYTMSNSENGVVVECDYFDTIEVTSKYVGFVRYEGVNNWINKSCDRHFVAFSTDMEIDKLYEADIYYQTQLVHLRYLDNSSLNNNKPFSSNYGEIEDKYSHLSLFNNEVSVTVGSSGLIGNDRNFTYDWEGIQTVDEFLDSVNVEKVYSSGIFDVHIVSELTEEGKNDLEEMQWVLSFDATDYILETLGTGGGGDVDYTIVSNVSLMRLKFEYNDKIYNLGIIDNKQTGDGVPDNETNTYLTVKDIFKIIFYVILGLLVFVLLLTFFPSLIVGFLKLIFLFFKYLFKGIWYLITAPFSIFSDNG